MQVQISVSARVAVLLDRVLQNPTMEEKLIRVLEQLDSQVSQSYPPVNAALIKLAKTYNKGVATFVHDVLGVTNNAAANCLARAGWTPYQTVTATRDQLLSIRKFGVKHTHTIMTARSSWKPKQ